MGAVLLLIGLKNAVGGGGRVDSEQILLGDTHGGGKGGSYPSRNEPET